MVYNFTLPPLLLYSLATGNARVFSDWAQTLVPPRHERLFLILPPPMTASGCVPWRGFCPHRRLHGWRIESDKTAGRFPKSAIRTGPTSPYELNITYLDALKNPAVSEDPLHIPRFLASQAVVLALPGVPAVYIHSLLGSQNWTDGVRLTGRARTINRARLSADAVCAELADPKSVRARIFYPYLDMIRIRIRQPAFHPAAGMQILSSMIGFSW